MASISASYLDHLRRHEPNTTVPFLRWVVQHVVDLDAIVVSRQSINLVLEQNVLGVDLGEDEVHGCLVASGTKVLLVLHCLPRTVRCIAFSSTAKTSTAG
jgi:hypothetical protein